MYEKLREEGKTKKINSLENRWQPIFESKPEEEEEEEEEEELNQGLLLSRQQHYYRAKTSNSTRLFCL